MRSNNVIKMLQLYCIVLYVSTQSEAGHDKATHNARSEAFTVGKHVTRYLKEQVHAGRCGM